MLRASARSVYGTSRLVRADRSCTRHVCSFTHRIAKFFVLAGSQSGLLYAAPLMGGDDGTEQIVRLIRSLVDDAWRNGEVNKFAVDLIRSAGVQQYDDWGQVRAVYDWVHTNFYFVNDPVTKQALKPVVDMLQPENRFGNCANINATILPALLGAIGFETRLVSIAADPRMPDSFSHVYCEVFVDGNWYPLDAARPGASFGMAPPSYYRREWWSLTDGSHGDYDETGTMEGAGLRGFRGLGNAVSDLSMIFTDASGVLRSVSGQAVQPAVQSVIGPGGAMSTAPGAAAPVSTGTELLLLLAAGALIWWLM